MLWVRRTCNQQHARFSYIDVWLLSNIMEEHETLLLVLEVAKKDVEKLNSNVYFRKS